MTTSDLMVLLAERAVARRRGDYACADEIREWIRATGYKIIDQRHGRMVVIQGHAIMVIYDESQTEGST